MKLAAVIALAACGPAQPAPPRPTVQIVVDAPLDSVELERYVTVPIEVSLMGFAAVHSVTQFGRAVISVEYKGDPLAARQEIMARLENVQLPEGMHPDLGPLTTADGAIARYIVRGPGDPRTLQDWTIRARLLRVPGIADVSTCGSPAQQLEILVEPSQLDAVRKAFARRSDDLVVRAASFKVAEVPAIVATIPGAQLVHGTEPRTCVAADPSGHDLVVGTVWLRTGADRAEVTAALDRAFAELRTSGAKLDVVAGAYEATVAAPGTLDDFANLATAPALFESGRPDGGFLDGLPGELHVHAADRATARRAAEQLATSLQGKSWIDGTTITRIVGPDLAVLDHLASTIPDSLERSTARAVTSINLNIDRVAASNANLDIETINDQIAAAQTGLAIGEAWDGDHRIEIVARTKYVLPAVVSQTNESVPAVILRDNGQRYVLVRTHGAISKPPLPPGYTAR